jgi:hypothetical protein
VDAWTSEVARLKRDEAERLEKRVRPPVFVPMCMYAHVHVCVRACVPVHKVHVHMHPNIYTYTYGQKKIYKLHVKKQSKQFLIFACYVHIATELVSPKYLQTTQHDVCVMCVPTWCVSHLV